MTASYIPHQHSTTACRALDRSRTSFVLIDMWRVLFGCVETKPHFGFCSTREGPQRWQLDHTRTGQGPSERYAGQGGCSQPARRPAGGTAASATRRAAAHRLAPFVGPAPRCVMLRHQRFELVTHEAGVGLSLVVSLEAAKMSAVRLLLHACGVPRPPPATRDAPALRHAALVRNNCPRAAP